MAVKIRLKRMGAKKNPFYRVVVADARSPRDGRVIDEIGYYDPVKQPAVAVINEEKALDWLKKGAQLTETARALFRKAGVLQKFNQK
ncbi:30S ribosomal protein S16 [Carboxydothermus pertinax]|uniref:Small ribosomal subunit protein bS16 n=1 Tax=Carboxydothermus pertinax TaxID=870242 RepID=A0A1L8CXL9_9THEO|nr:30S ribosomal protein S16 [Carboxydothermus pertinax]GAV23676.1 30S ribosomal protein S16 [Carboxydothermus pertinax]